MNGAVLFRADASAQIGTGHVMRCLALAHACRDNGLAVHFASASLTESLQQRLAQEQIGLTSISHGRGTSQDAQATARLAEELRAEWIVADGYCFDSRYQQIMKEADCRLLLLDDYGHAEHYFADYVLNQNPSAEPALYRSREQSTQLLLGPAYALLRREFEPWRAWRRVISETGRRVLITLGGSDPTNLTGSLMAALGAGDLPQLELVVVIGGSNPHRDELAKTENPGCVRLIVDPPDMPELMAQADIAIAAGGTTALELAFMGLPSALFVLAPNQAAIAQALDREGVATNMGSRDESRQEITRTITSLLVDQQRRQAMHDNGRKLVDGYGAVRVLERCHLSPGHPVQSAR